MQINVETKFNVGDEVFYLGHNGKIEKKAIKHISIFVDKDGNVNVLCNLGDFISKYENEVFKTQEELIEAIRYKE